MTPEPTDLRATMHAGEMDRRMAVARRRAEWELGDAAWADTILAAFFDPAADTAALRAEMEDA